MKLIKYILITQLNTENSGDDFENKINRTTILIWTLSVIFTKKRHSRAITTNLIMNSYGQNNLVYRRYVCHNELNDEMMNDPLPEFYLMQSSEWRIWQCRWSTVRKSINIAVIHCQEQSWLYLTNSIWSQGVIKRKKLPTLKIIEKKLSCSLRISFDSILNNCLFIRKV